MHGTHHRSGRSLSVTITMALRMEIAFPNNFIKALNAVAYKKKTKYNEAISLYIYLYFEMSLTYLLQTFAWISCKHGITENSSSRRSRRLNEVRAQFLFTASDWIMAFNVIYSCCAVTIYSIHIWRLFASGNDESNAQEKNGDLRKRARARFQSPNWRRIDFQVKQSIYWF